MAEKEHEDLRQAFKDRARHIRADLEAIDSDGEEEPCARKPIADRQASVVFLLSASFVLQPLYATPPHLEDGFPRALPICALLHASCWLALRWASTLARDCIPPVVDRFAAVGDNACEWHVKPC